MSSASRRAQERGRVLFGYVRGRAWRPAALGVLLLAAILLPAGVHAQTTGPTVDEGSFSEGLLWEVSRGAAAPSYVFGTIHLSDERVRDLPAPLVEVLDRVDSLSIEIVFGPEADALIATAARIPLGEPTLHERLDDDRLLRLYQIAERHGISLLILDHFKPWVVATILSMPPEELVSLHPSLDEVLQIHATMNDIPVYGLETVEEQFAVMDGLPDAVGMAMLEQAIDDYDRLQVVFEIMVTGYLEGRTGELLTLFTTSWTGDQESIMEILLQEVIDRRNDRMVERMSPRLTEGNALIAVGAAHLPGPRGILAQLADKGFKVERLH